MFSAPPPQTNVVDLDQLQPFQAGVALRADDDVVVHRDAERLGDIHDRLRHLDVAARRRRIARRMIVREPTRCLRALKSEQFAVVTSELGAVIGGGSKCPFVIIPVGHAPFGSIISQHVRSCADDCFGAASEHSSLRAACPKSAREIWQAAARSPYVFLEVVKRAA